MILDQIGEQPEFLNPVLKLMKNCWHGQPTKRPTFDEILKDLRNVYNHHLIVNYFSTVNSI